MRSDPRWPRLLTFALCLFLPASLPAQRPYHLGPPPTWVTPIHADVTLPPPEGRITEGYELLLLDRQESVTGDGQERFRHVAYRLLDDRAVEQNSQIELVFDPTYERLTLHGVTVVRNGRTIDQLKPDRIRVVRRESGMDYQVFDGSLSLVLVLEGVTRGDVIEYSYTRRGANPVFAGHYSAGFVLQETVPIREQYLRLLWPRERPLYLRRQETTAEPSMRTEGVQQEYLWTARNVPPLVLDQDLPNWYDPFPGVRVSDFASWSAVAAWGDTLFASPGPMPPALSARLAGIRSANPSRQAQALAALRYVQEDVRYLGVEIGVNSHRPYPIADVVRRGYGDCKDKAQLLVAMLRALGIQAWPALVSTTYRSHIRDLQPASGYFDHAIVLAEVEGQPYWLDPTNLYQRGDLPAVAPPFGAALVLGRDTDSLATIPQAPAAEPATEVAVTFELADTGTPATMRVETRYHGRAADRMRETTRTLSPEKLQQEFVAFYAEGYPGIRSEALPLVDDDEAANVVHTTERYSIPGFWHRSANEPGYVGTFDPVELDQAIPSPTAAGRTMPLAVVYPTRYRYTITAHLADGWGIAPRADTIETPALRFVRSLEAHGQELTLDYEYQALADHVDVAAAPAHLERLSRVRRLLPFTVTPPRTAASLDWSDPQELNWPVLLAALFTTGFAVLAALRLNRSPAPAWPRGPTAPGAELAGLGGWLIPVGLGVAIMPLMIIATLVKTAPAYTASSWAAHTTPGESNYHSLWAPVLLLEMVVNLGLLVFTSLQAWQFFHRKRWFPALFVMLAAARGGAAVVDDLLSNAIPAAHGQGTQWEQRVLGLLALALWVGYMFRSRRVRNTFVN